MADYQSYQQQNEPQMISAEYDKINPKSWIEIAVRQVLSARSIDYQNFLQQYTTAVFNLEVALVGELSKTYEDRINEEIKRLKEDSSLTTTEREFYLARFKFKELVRSIKLSIPEERDLEV